MARYVGVQGEPLAVDLYEPARHRGDALLIHGYTGSKEDFAEVGPFLSARGYRVVAFDLRGQHELAHSDRYDAYAIASLAADSLRLADRFALDRPHLLGHSFGGLVAQRAVVMRPNGWASLTLLCSGPHGRSGVAEFTEHDRHPLRPLDAGGLGSRSRRRGTQEHQVRPAEAALGAE